MKLQFVTFRKILPNGKWEIDPESQRRTFTSKNRAVSFLAARHTDFRGGNVFFKPTRITKILPGGTVPNTADVEWFFDYTFAPWPGKQRIRYREALRLV